MLTRAELLERISFGPDEGGGKPCIKGTRVYVAIVLDAIVEGLTPAEVVDHYPSLELDDVRAAIAYGAELAHENVWKVLA